MDSSGTFPITGRNLQSLLQRAFRAPAQFRVCVPPMRSPLRLRGAGGYCTIKTRPRRRAFGKRPPAPRKPKGKPGRPFFGARGGGLGDEQGTSHLSAVRETTWLRAARVRRRRPRLAAVCASAVFFNTKIINYKQNSTTKRRSCIGKGAAEESPPGGARNAGRRGPIPNKRGARARTPRAGHAACVARRVRRPPCPKRPLAAACRAREWRAQSGERRIPKPRNTEHTRRAKPRAASS